MKNRKKIYRSNNPNKKEYLMKSIKTILMVLFFSAVCLAPFSQVLADQKIALMGTDVQGEATIKDNGKSEEIVIHVTGLKPGGVYTVWLVDKGTGGMDMAGVGKGDYSFKSDGKGTGHYAASMATDELKKWRMLEIAYHPDGNPKNMMKMDIALKASLK